MAFCARSAFGTLLRSASKFRIGVRGYADVENISFTFASPAQVLYNKAVVKQIDVPSMNGMFGILPKHVPVLEVLKPGVVTVYESTGTAKRFFVSSGTVTVNDDSSVQVLAEEACRVEDLDLPAIRENLSKAQRDSGAAGSEKARAEAQIAVETLEAMAHAAESAGH